MMNFYKITLALLLCCIVGQHAHAQGIKFETETYEKTRIAARENKKIIFIDCYTQWCGPCKKLAKTVFTDPQIGDYFNQNFLNLKIDMESNEGETLKKKFKVFAYPTLLWVNHKGEVLHRYTGYCDRDKLLKLANKSANNKENLAALETEFKNGNRDYNFLCKYIYTASEARINTSKIFEALFSLENGDEIITSDDFNLISRGVESSEHPLFKNLIQNKSVYNQKLGKEVVDKFFKQTFVHELMKVFGTPTFEKKMKEMKQKYPGESKSAILFWENKGYGNKN